jgi:hypothetical protein
LFPSDRVILINGSIRTIAGGDMAPLLEMKGISKAFPGVQALKDVDLNWHPAKCTPSLAKTVPENRRS